MSSNFIEELRRRQVFRAAAMYLVVAWLLLQVADVVVPALRLPEWTLTLILVLFVLGFPLALVLAWIYDLTPQGIRRESADESRTSDSESGRRPDRALFVLVGIAVLVLVVERFLPEDDRGQPAKPSTQVDERSTSAPAQQVSRAESVAVVEENSIAVMPFQNLSGDPEQEFFSDGMTHDLITDLSRISGLFVVASSSVFTYKDKTVRPQEVAHELGVRYILEGSVRRAGDDIRINAQLVDTGNGRQLWAERYDGTMTDVFALQDEVARQIIGSLVPQLSSADVDQLKPVSETVPDAYDLLLQGLGHMRRYSPEEVTLAREYFLRAIEVDPGYARAYANVGLTYALPVEYGWSQSPEKDAASAEGYAKQALDLNPNLSMVYGSLAMTYMTLGDIDRALDAIDKALEIDPNYADGYTVGAHLLTYAGEFDRGEEMLTRATRLNPRYSFNEVQVMGNLDYLRGRYEEAAVHYEEVLRRNPQMPMGRKWLAATYARLGREEDAQWEVEETLMIMPDFSVSQEAGTVPIRRPEHLENYIEGLRLAGFPD